MEKLAGQGPVAVFDSGIGSYAIVDLLRKKAPAQDILYLADRKNFPYGGKNKEELFRILKTSVDFLSTFQPSAIIVASNAPSIMILNELKKVTPIPIYGVEPPLKEALEKSRSKCVAILGVKSLIESPELNLFVKTHGQSATRVALVNASSLVESVENGAFLFQKRKTQKKVNAFIRALRKQYPDTDAITLSSTHLPWLKTFFNKANKKIAFLDPAEQIVSELPLQKTGPPGTLRCFVTESPTHSFKAFQKMLQNLQISIQPTLIPPLI